MMETATNWTRRAWKGQAGVIWLGFVASSTFVDLPEILRKAAKDLPDVQILLREMATISQKDAVHANTIDVAILRPPIEHGKYGRFGSEPSSFLPHFMSAIRGRLKES